jgi:quinol monooxygenase YgiN
VSVIVITTTIPRPGHRDEVIAALTEAIPQVHAEEGCELYALLQGEDRLVTVEKWASPQALDRHSNGAALAALDARLAEATEPPAWVVLQPVPAGDPAKGQL